MNQLLKTSALAVLGALSVASCAAQEAAAPRRVPVSVDQRVELVSVIFRLAGAKEYTEGALPGYTREVDAYFGRFASHPAVKLAAKLRESRGIAYNAPMGLAVHADNARQMKELIRLSPRPESLDNRWTTKDARKFLSLAADFSERSKFTAFYAAQQPLYAQAEQRMRKTLETYARPGWFDTFFGPARSGEFKVILGMLNGNNSYGANLVLPGGREEIYSVLGVGTPDAEGVPEFSGGYAQTVIHELTHAYTNPVVDRFAAQLEDSGKKIFPLVADRLRAQAYGNWRTLMYESLVRACQLRYTLATYGRDYMEITAAHEVSRGFFWVPGLAEALGKYEAERGTYKDLDSFMPEVVAYFNAFASAPEAAIQKIKGVKDNELAEWKEKGPRIVSMVPESGAKDVSPQLEKFTVTFDRPMTGGFSVVRAGAGEHPYKTGKAGYSADQKTFTMRIDLEPGTSYSFSLNAPGYTNFKSAEGIPFFPELVTFSTGK